MLKLPVVGLVTHCITLPTPTQPLKLKSYSSTRFLVSLIVFHYEQELR